MTITAILPENLLATSDFQYVDKKGDLQTGRLSVGRPFVEEQWFSCEFMVEKFFRNPELLSACNSLQAVGLTYRRLAQYLKMISCQKELNVVSVENFDEHSKQRKIDIFDVLTTKPDYNLIGPFKTPGFCNFDDIAVELQIDFKPNSSRVSKPITITMSTPWEKDSRWHCSYFLNGLMPEPRTTSSSDSLSAFCLALRQLQIPIREKDHQGTFYTRKFDGKRTLEEFKLKSYFHERLDLT